MRRILVFLLLLIAQFSARANLSTHERSHTACTCSEVTSISPVDSILFSSPWNHDASYTAPTCDFEVSGATFTAAIDVLLSVKGWVAPEGIADHFGYPVIKPTRSRRVGNIHIRGRPLFYL